MKSIKISLTVLIPAVIGGLTFCAFYAITGHFAALFSHDVYESHLHGGLIPVLAAGSLFFGFIPALFYTANLIWKLPAMPAQEAEQAKDILTSTINVGQIFSIAGSNCKLRVKALKNDLFNNADFSNVEYCLNFSF